MTEQAPEFSRIVRLDQVGKLSGAQIVKPTEEERLALARRFGLLSLDDMEARYSLAEENGALTARGSLRATLSQSCIATGEPVPEEVDTSFAVRFVPSSAEPSDDEIELDDDDCDTIFYSGESIDIGEAVAETLALAMTPYPRSPNADAYLKKMGVMSEEQASPFAALLALKEPKKAK
ncbi:MAG: YceD family protein [Sphingobium phenoxybenzoativorans]